MIKFLNSIQLSNEFFSCPPDSGTIFYAGKTPVNCKGSSFSIKSLSTLKELLAQEEETVFRFLVDTAGKLWFAFETRPHNNAPKHFQMTGEPLEIARCLTAGNIKFTNKTGSVLKNISHRSGDFHPSFLSLRWLLAILVINEELLPFKLSKLIVIKEIKNDKTYKHIWRLKKIKKWVDGFRDNETLINQLNQENLDSKTVHYKSTRYLVEESPTFLPERERKVAFS
ncbi:hypothetical protein [Legionella saoudiensis]|uniref:hypothetical protein n=1 Tax=Legionella saoudiensis TaxID=1750561 RepID=UPI00073170FF|nr:hypothetical protein [Legionella saoudiensis]